jgi:hypothetical protein
MEEWREVGRTIKVMRHNPLDWITRPCFHYFTWIIEWAGTLFHHLLLHFDTLNIRVTLLDRPSIMRIVRHSIQNRAKLTSRVSFVALKGELFVVADHCWMLLHVNAWMQPILY